jgi:hypothetical protein
MNNVPNESVYQTLNDCAGDCNSSNISAPLLELHSRLFNNSSFFISFGLLVAFLTIIGNIFVILAFIVDKKLQKYSNYFILNMAIADLMIGFLILAYTALEASGNLNGVLCTMWLTLDYVAGSASVLCIVAISFDRYLLVSRGLSYLSKQKIESAIIINCTVWGKQLVSFVHGSLRSL